MGYEDHDDDQLRELLENWSGKLAAVQTELLRRGTLRRRKGDRISTAVTFDLLPEAVTLRAQSSDISPAGLRAVLEEDLCCRVEFGETGSLARICWVNRREDGRTEIGLQYLFGPGEREEPDGNDAGHGAA